MDSDALVTACGLELVRTYLTKELGEDELDKLVSVWNEFEDCKRVGATIDEFLSNYDRAYNAISCTFKSASIPSEIRAFMVLKRSGATESQRMMVLSQLNKDDSICTTIFVES